MARELTPRDSKTDRLAAAINTAADGLAKGSKVWFKKDEQTWLAAELKTTPSASSPICTIQLEDGKQAQVDGSSCLPANPKLQDGIPDLTHLSYLNEPGILYNLQHRYATDSIYTFAGPVLIALNPCKTLPLYTPEVANTYKAGAKDVINNLPPHIYLVAANAFRKMVREKQSQTLIVNGESGAGKTETTKKAMQYFATLAGGTGVEDQVLETNPILEAFGNAKTLRNHNSSRFGKLIQIHFNQSNHICGARIKTYLLEKSRVVRRLPGERSYHIFYHLVKGANSEERVTWHLPSDPAVFKFLAQSECMEIDGVNDAKEFALVRSALTHIGIDSAQQSRLFALLSGVLWLGNVELEVNHNDNTTDSTKVKDTEALGAACQLLGVSKQALVTALTSKRIITPGEVVIKVLNVDEARDARDSLAKAVYAAIFNWIVERINIKLDTARRGAGLSISILDIYGFEQFQRNSFEQLCINYANERLQQQFTRHLFTLEQEEYESEGIDWTKVEFIDNQDCVDVIEQMPPKGLGVLAVLDSQCKFPKASDDTFVTALKEKLNSHANFSTNPRNPRDFIILHYAGHVQYDSQGFLDKNKDTLSTDLIELMQSSHEELPASLGNNVREEVDSSSKRGQTVGLRFALQLKDLIQELDQTGLHFVRCIKPNTALAPNRFESAMVLHQLRCCGVLEVARIAAAGYPTRYSHAQFAERYVILLKAEEQAALLGGGSALKACERLIQGFGLQKSQYQLGHTKVFFRPGVLGLVEDRWARMQWAATALQAGWRMHKLRREFLGIKAAAIRVQSLYRTRLEVQRYREMKRKYEAAMIVQRIYRMRVQRKLYKQKHAAAMKIQMAWRRMKLRKRLKKRTHEREKRDFFARLEQESFNSIKKEFNVEMDDVRQALALFKAQQMGQPVAAPLVAARGEVTAPVAAPAPGPLEAGALAHAAPAESAASNAQRWLGATASGGLPHAVSDRFEAIKEKSQENDRVVLENMKLQKQLQLERSLKDRYQHKYEEQNLMRLEELRVLQGYISQIRDMFGDAKLPPMPASVAAATQPSLPNSTSMARALPSGGSGSFSARFTDGPVGHAAPVHRTDASTCTSRNSPVRRMDRACDALPLPSTSPTAAPPPPMITPFSLQPKSFLSQADVSTDTVDLAGSRSIDLRSQSSSGAQLSAAAANFYGPAGPVTASQVAQAVGTSPNGSRNGRLRGSPPAAANLTPSQKYVGQLSKELDTVSAVLVDDVDFIREVKEGVANIPATDMDPNAELYRLRKKFDIWKREFKEKLKTTEDVLRKIDRMERRAHRDSANPNNIPVSRSSAVPPSNAMAATYTGAGAPSAFAGAQFSSYNAQPTGGPQSISAQSVSTINETPSFDSGDSSGNIQRRGGELQTSSTATSSAEPGQYTYSVQKAKKGWGLFGK